jgi:plastocyanin domain-containing protein
MRKYLVTTHEKCIVEYDYVVEAENEYEAVRRFVTVSGFDTCDHRVIADLETIRIDSVKDLGEAT